MTSPEPNFFEPDWFHDSPMPKVHDRAKFYLQFPENGREGYTFSLLQEGHGLICLVMDDSNLGIPGLLPICNGDDNTRRSLDQ